MFEITELRFVVGGSLVEGYSSKSARVPLYVSSTPSTCMCRTCNAAPILTYTHPDTIEIDIQELSNGYAPSAMRVICPDFDWEIKAVPVSSSAYD